MLMQYHSTSILTQVDLYTMNYVSMCRKIITNTF